MRPCIRLPDRPWAQHANAVAASLGTIPSCGLSAAEATDRLERFGLNELKDCALKPSQKPSFDRFMNTLIVALGIAAVVKVIIMGDQNGALILLLIVAFTGALGSCAGVRRSESSVT